MVNPTRSAILTACGPIHALTILPSGLDCRSSTMAFATDINYELLPNELSRPKVLSLIVIGPLSHTGAQGATLVTPNCDRSHKNSVPTKLLQNPGTSTIFLHIHKRLVLAVSLFDRPVLGSPKLTVVASCTTSTNVEWGATQATKH